MRIGIVCEGATDAHALVHFLGASLRNRGVNAVFVALQPDMDKTSPDGGWGLVLKWFEHNPPNARIRTYFDGGLFDHGLSARQCDVIVFQMDADNLSDEPFRNRMRASYDRDIVEPCDPIDRGNEVRAIIRTAGGFEQLSQNDRNRHVAAPAVESTETWCIAVFQEHDHDPELLRSQELCERFMTVLHRSEGRRIQEFVQINKSSGRRRRFCEKHSTGFTRLERQCYHYRCLVGCLVAA